MKNNQNLTIYKAYSQTTSKYYYIIALSINEEIIYYRIKYIGNIPIIEKITKAIDLLINYNYEITDIKKGTEEYNNIIRLLTDKIDINIQANTNEYTTPISEKDTKLLLRLKA